MLENAGRNQRFMRMAIAFETGWSLEYLDDMEMDDWFEVAAFVSARSYLEEREARKNRARS